MITKDTTKGAVLGIASDCKQCGNCCKYGSGYVLESEIIPISDSFNMSEDEFKQKYMEEKILFNKKVYKFKSKDAKKPFSECIFLKNNTCDIHEVKPLHCKIANCNEFGEELNEWFIINNLIDADDPVAIREWASRLKSKQTIHGANLDELVPDEKKLQRILDYKIVR